LVPVIVWLNGTHGAGKTTTSALVHQLIPDSRVFDAEKVGETLMHITPAQAAHQIAEALKSRRERRTTWADG
jgi:adenylylsulfate kinase-like enzyme